METRTESKKCGEILIELSGNFTLVCVVCSRGFITLRSFAIHINSQHIIDSDTSDLSPLRQDTLEDSIVEDEPLSLNNKQHEETVNSRFPGVESQIKDETKIANIEASAPFSEDMGLQQIVEYEDYYSEDSDHTTEPHKEDSNSGHDLRSQINDETKNTNEQVCQRTSRSAPTTLTMTCKYCDAVFTDVVTFKKHWNAHLGSKKFVCPLCPKTFDRPSTRTQHILTHTGERPYKCSYCPKAFSEKANMVRHENIHLGIKKYACQYCDKSFVHPSDRKVHEMSHTGEKPYQCEECGKRYSLSYKLKVHMRVHTNTRDYKCHVCNMAFYTGFRLRNHIKVHTKDRPYRCEVCGRDFARQNTLLNHKKLHCSEKKYICPICGKAFAQFSGLYSHKKSHGQIPI